MKLLILGGNGMAGHVLVQYFRSRPDWGVFYTSRRRDDCHALYLDAAEEEETGRLLDMVRPHVVINAIGILNQQAENNETLAYRLNGMLPHQLRKRLDSYGSKLVHISTDCIFSGDRGDYTEDDAPDGTTVYAKSKAIGEVRHPPHLTVRTSIIGPEIRENGIGLFNWFMSQQGTVQGYSKVLWNGITTLQLAKSLEQMLQQGISGLVHLTAPEQISKLQLLMMMKQTFGKTDVVIESCESFTQNRTLHNTRNEACLITPSYEVMLAELRDWMEGSRIRGD